MSGRLIFLVGPSGAGKDSLINFVRRQLPDELDVRFARRVITRPMSAGAEQHFAVSPFQFDLLRDEGEFVMHWDAHGEQFGIDREICDWLNDGATVVVTGSRHYLPKALEQFPDLTVVYVKASTEIRRARLTACLRATPEAIEARLQRGVDWKAPAGVSMIELVNEGDLPNVGRRLLDIVAGVARGAVDQPARPAAAARRTVTKPASSKAAATGAASATHAVVKPAQARAVAAKAGGAKAATGKGAGGKRAAVRV